MSPSPRPPGLADLAEQFRGLGSWISSPLYRRLGPVVADDPALLAIADDHRPGQVPVSLFFAAVHFLLLSGAQHDLASYYPTVVGEGARDPDDAGPVLVDFVRTHHDPVTELVRTRLVQKQVVNRSALLRLGLWAVGRVVDGPVHLVEVGASAGVHLRFDRYQYRLGGVRFGNSASPVLIAPQWRGDEPVPDLDAVPALASTTGIDLDPIDAADPVGRRWLQALVWPECTEEAAALHQALTVVSADPPHIVPGDIIDVAEQVAGWLPLDQPRVVFHAATRLHVPAQRLADFDAAIERFGRSGPMFHLALESAPSPGGDPVFTLRGPAGSEPAALARCDGYLRWLEPSLPPG